MHIAICALALAGIARRNDFHQLIRTIATSLPRHIGEWLAAAAALCPENSLHGLSLAKLVNQLVEPSDLLHERIIYLLDANTANHALDQ